MMMYVRLSEGLTKYRLISDKEDIWKFVKTNDKDYYVGVYKYNEDHYKMYKATGTVAGIRDTTTNALIFDFDDANNLENARKDCLTLVSRFLAKGVHPDAVQISFSGNKGFCVQVDTDQTFTPEQFKQVTFALANDLPTFDKVVNDSQRLIRLIGTKNQKSGLYKIPLTIDKLAESSIESIKSEASSLDNFDENVLQSWVPTKLPEEIVQMSVIKVVEKKSSITELHDLNMSAKPKWLSDAKYALQNGYFGAGERNTAFMVLASTYRNQAFPKEVVYRMLKGVAEIQATRNGVERYSDEELYNNVVEVIFSPTWKGGSYSYENTPLLQEVTKRLNLKVPGKADETYEPKHIHSIHGKFKDYVKNIDKNTIKTGIDSLDKNIFISTGCNMAIVGAPGSGKTSLTLNILNNTSKAGIKSVFASFDMARTRMYEKILYKLTALPRETLYQKMIEDPAWEERIFEQVKEEFGNVYFFDKSAATVADIRNYIIQCNEAAGSPEDRVKLIMIDYFERVHTDVGDDTAASKKVANELQDLVAEFDLAQIVLLQPNKMSGSLSEPITSYMSIKGSSFLQQSFRVILGIYREGFDPLYPEDDRFMTVNVLKNDLGETNSIDLSWEGKRGIIYEMDDEARSELKALRREIESSKKDDL